MTANPWAAAAWWFAPTPTYFNSTPSKPGHARACANSFLRPVPTKPEPSQADLEALRAAGEKMQEAAPRTTEAAELTMLVLDANILVAPAIATLDLVAELVQTVESETYTRFELNASPVRESADATKMTGRFWLRRPSWAALFGRRTQLYPAKNAGEGISPVEIHAPRTWGSIAGDWAAFSYFSGYPRVSRNVRFHRVLVKKWATTSTM
jgi:hypothetical protein